MCYLSSRKILQIICNISSGYRGEGNAATGLHFEFSREKLYYFLKFKECEGAVIAKKHFSLPLSQIMYQQKHEVYCLHIVQCQAAIQRTDSWVCLLTSSHLAPRPSHTLQGQRRNSRPNFSPPSCRQCRRWSLSHLSCPGYQIQIVRTIGTLI